MKTKISLVFISLIFTLGLFLSVFSSAKAEISQSGPPMYEMFMDKVVGPGSTVVLGKFMLMGDGATALTKVGFMIRASSTMNSLNQIAGVSLYRESGSKFGFSPLEDTYVSGTYAANPAIDALIVLQPSGGYVVPSQNTEFFIVASTSAIADIINGNAFDVAIEANYASTSASTAVGTAPMQGSKKFILQKTIPVKISEVKAGTAANGKDEFIELYNPNDNYIDLQAAGLALHSFNASGGAVNRAIAYAPGKNSIAPFGYFLLTSATNYSGSVSPDATFNNLSSDLLVANGGISLATSTAVADATSTKIDLIGWGSQPEANCENADTIGIGSNCALTLAEDGSSLERIARGYTDATSTALTMVGGGADAYKGNGLDRNDNSEEFVAQASPNPQNSMSPAEFPFGGGMVDNTAPTVMGSYPQSGMTGVPADMQFIGFGFSEPLQMGTINSSSATTTVTLKASGSDTNLCSSIVYNPMPGSFEPQTKCILSGSLSPNTTYSFEVGTSTGSGILDLAGNRLDQDSFQQGVQSYRVTFTTGGSSQAMTNITPPNITKTLPFMGSFNIPSNIKKFFITFSQKMDASTLNSSNIKLYSNNSGTRSEISLASAVYSYDATSSVLTIGSLPSLSDNARYEIDIDGRDGPSDTSGVKSSNGILLPMGSWIIAFTTGVADNSAPVITSAVPVQNGASNVALNSTLFTLSFNDNMDLSTATSGAVTLSIQEGSALPATFSYDPASKEGALISQNLLPAGQTLVLTAKGGSLRNVSGTQMGSNHTIVFSTEDVNSDNSAPSVMSVNADDFAIAVTFNEPVNSTDAVNLSNYSVTAGGQSVSLNSMAGHTITYNASTRTAKISGIRLQSGSAFSVTASNIRDISGNTMTSSTGSGTVMSMSSTGGMIDPGMTGGSMGTPPPPKTFTGAGGVSGFMPPANIMVMNNFVSASSTYGFEIPISTQIPANGQIVITFPSTADFGLCCAATSSANAMILNDMNRDINGPGTGTVGIKTITKDAQSKTVTLILDSATRSENGDTHDFLRFGLTDIKNPSVAKGADSSGYSLDIKTKAANGSTILESSFNTNPVYIGGGVMGGVATTTIRGKILSSYDGTTGLNGVTVMLQSPILGPMPRTAASADSVWGASAGEFQFTDLPINNDYFIFTESSISPSGTSTTYFGFNEPAPVRAASTDAVVKNITLNSAASAVTLTVKLTASASTFTSSEKIDIFAGGSGQFSVKTAQPGTGTLSDATVAILSLPSQNGMWFVGIGPAMPKDGMMMGPPPSPNWVMPKPLELNMSGCPSACSLSENGMPKTSHTFNISSASKVISGLAKDANGGTLAQAMVYAYSPSQMMGAHGQTDTAGKFSLNVTEGLYNVGAFFPGMGQSKEVSVEVTSAASDYVYANGSKTSSTGQSGANPLVVTIKKPSYTITGKVSDGTNYIANAPVFAYRTDGPGHADAMTDSSGNYTLYVDNGAWRVNAHVPGYGQMSEQSVTVSGSNQSNINFAPSGSVTYWSVTGTVFESGDATIDSGEGVANVIVAVKRNGSIYESKTGSDGVYTVRVPEAASGYFIEVFKPGYGKISSVAENLSAISSFGVAATTTKNIRIPTRRTVTINIKDSSGNFLAIPEAFIDLFDMSKNSGNHAEIRNGTSTSLQISDMSSTTLRIFIPAVPPNSIYFDSDNGGSTTFADAGKTVLNVDGNEVVKVVVNANLRTVSGVVYHTSATSGNELKDVWIEIVDTANGMHYGVSATSSAGTYGIKLADGSYKIMAVKPGYLMMPQSLTVSGDATQNLVLASAGYAISGAVTAGGSAAPYAFVRAEKTTGGSTVTQADASGNYSLSVDAGSWRVYAASDKYTEAGYSGNPVVITSSSQSGINIALSTAANINSTLASSQNFKDTSSGSFDDATTKTKVLIDSGGLGQAGSDSYITANETANFPDTPTVDVIGGKAKDINAYSGGSQVKNLSSGKKATIELSYTLAELAMSGIDTPAEVGKLKVSTINEQKEWESLSTVATYKDSSGNAIAVATTSSSIPGTVAQITFTTAEATHFSPYALTQASDPTAPSTPTGLAAATVNESGKISLSWNANSESDLSGYYLYRSSSSGGSFAKIAEIAAGTVAYTDTGLNSATTYYYKVSAYDSSGFESAASSEVSAATISSGGGGVMGGGGSGSGVPTPTPTVIPGSSSSVSSQVSSNPQVSSSASSLSSLSSSSLGVIMREKTVTITKTLKLDSENGEVKSLQEFLAKYPEMYPEGKITGYFGPATKRAVQRFQKKHGIESTGIVGPLTRAKISESVSVSSTGITETKTISTPAGVTITKTLKPGMENDEVKTLQELLAKDPEIYPEGKVSGYFGSLTKKAVERFQKKYGIEAVGFVGPQTRAKISEIFRGKAGQDDIYSSSSSPQTTSSQEIGKSKEKQVEKLQAQIKQLEDLIKSLKK